MSVIKIASEAETIQFFKQCYGSKIRSRRIYGFYSSDFNKIITDEHLMLIPIDQRMATRAHAVFDVVYAKKLNLINLEAHVNRLVKSSQSVSINPPMSAQQMIKTIQTVMSEIMSKMLKQGQTKKSLYTKDFGIRMCVSSGYGDFGIVSIDKKPVFYMSVFEPYINYDIEKEGVNEYVVKYVDDNISDLVHTKTVNYIDNALMANKSKVLGGYQGIKATKNGILREASMANIAFMIGKEFVTPRFETVIQGTTIKKLLKYVEQLKQEGLIEKISFRDITISEAETTATQMIIIGGDKIVPVLKFNDKQISQKKGVFTAMFQQWYQKQNEIAIPIFIEQL